MTNAKLFDYVRSTMRVIAGGRDPAVSEGDVGAAGDSLASIITCSSKPASCPQHVLCLCLAGSHLNQHLTLPLYHNMHDDLNDCMNEQTKKAMME